MGHALWKSVSILTLIVVLFVSEFICNFIVVLFVSGRDDIICERKEDYFGVCHRRCC